MVIKGSGGGGFPPGWRDEAIHIANEPLSKYDPVQARLGDLHMEGISADIPLSPANNEQYTVMSSDGRYLYAVTYAPNLRIYERQGNAFVLVNEVAGPVSNKAINGISLSPDNTLLALTSSAAVNLYGFYIFRVSGANVDTANPVYRLSKTYSWPVWSPDGQYIAFSCDDPYSLFVLKRGTNGSFTSLQTPAMDGIKVRTTWSPNGTYLVCTRGAGNLQMIKRTGDTFAIMSGIYANGTGIGKTAFSPDGRYFAAAGNGGTSGSVTVYKWDGISLISLFRRGTIMDNDVGISVEWTPDGRYLLATFNVAPFYVVYRQEGDTFTEVGVNLYQNTSAAIGDIRFSVKGDIMVTCPCGGNNTATAYIVPRTYPYAERLKHGSNLDFGGEITGIGTAMASASKGDTVRVNLLKPVNDIWTNGSE